MKWLNFVRDFRADHPHIGYRDALKQCKEPYRKMKAKQKCTPRRRAKAHNPFEDAPNLCEKTVKLSKRMKQCVKDECGIVLPRPKADRQVFLKSSHKKKQKKNNRFKTLLERDYIWVFRTPDGRSVQTNLEELQPSHRSARWVLLGRVGRMVFKVVKWLET